MTIAYTFIFLFLLPQKMSGHPSGGLHGQLAPRGMGGTFQRFFTWLLRAVKNPQASGMTEQSDGVTDARIQAAKVIAVILCSSYREPGEGGTGAERSLPISVRESSKRMGGREMERGHGQCRTMHGQ